jgi:hypothetical protein
MADLGESKILFLRAALARCVLLYEALNAPESWPNREWEISEGCPPMRMTLAAWSAADRWRTKGESEIIINAGEQLTHFLLGSKNQSFLASVDSWLFEASSASTIVEYRRDDEQGRWRCFVRKPEDIQKFLKTVPVTMRDFAEDAAAQYTEFLADQGRYLHAMTDWSYMRTS